MSSNSINSLSSGYVQSIISTALQSATGSSASNKGIQASSGVQQADSSNLSPFAQMMSQLQQLQQSDPGKYQQVTQQIASNLQNAAQTAQSQGNTTAANQLTQLASDFTSASSSGQLPNVQDLAQAVGGHHHHHHAQAASSDADGDSSGSSTASSGSSALSQLLSALQANSAGSDATNPMSIILNTLSSSGLGSSK